MEKVDILIIGAGVVGLAIAERLSKSNKDIFIVEKESSFGQGTSSRNSEVIHAGMYYPKDSLKAKTCVEGNRMLYELCENKNIPYKKLGKLVVATNKDEIAQVEKLYKQGEINGVEGLEIIDSMSISRLEPNIRGASALFSQNTGIIDSHKLMEYLCARAKENGANIAYQSEAKSIQEQDGAYRIDVLVSDKELFRFTSRIVINAAGLYSDAIAKIAGIDVVKSGYDLKYCKGAYFRLSSNKSSLVKRLVYPVPDQSNGGLGIHITPDISGQVKIGPDAEYLKRNIEDYEVDKNKLNQFYDSVIQFAPFIELNDISPDMAGIRPKLQGLDESFRDFVIKEESDKGLQGFINLIGLESPGLTAALSIAKYVEDILKTHLN
jgi:L-2-hydroxyglutarate oxidase LhgO